MLSELKGTGDMKSISLKIEGGSVDIKVNAASVPVIPFINNFIKNIVIGMVSSLKGVGKIDRLEISIIE